MQHSKLTVAAAIAVSAILGIGVASAADLPVKALPMVAAPAFSWTGFYGGINIGGGWGNRNNVNYSPNDPAAAVSLPVLVLPLS
jgi:outer membrane immunogenic protein